MTNELRLFSTGQKKKTIWYWTHKPNCTVCKNIITDFSAVFIVDWDKKKGRIDNLLHLGCVKKYKKSPLSITQYRWHVLITQVIPPKSVPIFIQNPSFSPNRSQTTVFEVDDIHSDKETDNAWRSKTYPSLEGVTIGKGELLEENTSPERDALSIIKETRKRLKP